MESKSANDTARTKARQNAANLGASLALNLGPALTPGQASDLPSAGQASLSACLAVYGMCGACVEHVWSV